ncbi:thioredoxin-like protein TLP1 [Cardiosporidium cionae]|uniref:Thioredoxin-like protein TLP1 n=1 Tax=Cardiosporidium cionae TaxID=476202 RepID=A0ABQ7J8I9_9APIC|nr:thioredoxin-like protein TLP1 [Cardiosporidium cionae]|eukprot:KAF8820311.1 thioredoxin-like protein TLP1 [Cardiosporidium cionae]
MSSLPFLNKLNKFVTPFAILSQATGSGKQMGAVFSSLSRKHYILQSLQRRNFNSVLSYTVNVLTNPTISHNCPPGQVHRFFPLNRVHCRTLLTEVDSVEAYQKKIDTEKLVVVQYSASWCGPCRQMKPIMSKLSNEEHDVEFLFVDIDDQSYLAQQAGIENVPTFVLMKKGKTVDKIIGANADKLRSSMQKYK